MKKNIVTVLSLAFICLCHASRGQQLTIIDQDYARAKQECEQQKKLLLIDFYTTWCGPCKYLDKTIFKDSLVNREMAKQFVVLKYDAEKDSTHQLTLKHHVSFYPTSLILNKDQRVLNRLYGFGGPDKDLPKNYKAFLVEAISRNNKNEWIKGISPSAYLSYPAFYREYVYRTNTKGSQEKVEHYWQTLSAGDYFSEVPFAILCYFGGGSDTINSFFLTNRDKYEDIYGNLDVRFIVTRIVSEKIYKAIEKKDRVAFLESIQLAKENLTLEELYPFVDIMEERMLQAENRWKEAAKKFAARNKPVSINEEETAAFCWEAWQHCNDKEVLKKCTRWMKIITDQKPAYATLDTYARLLYTTGDKKQGIKIMKQAISTGLHNKEDTRDSEEWLLKNKI